MDVRYTMAANYGASYFDLMCVMTTNNSPISKVANCFALPQIRGHAIDNK